MSGLRSSLDHWDFLVTRAAGDKAKGRHKISVGNGHLEIDSSVCLVAGDPDANHDEGDVRIPDRGFHKGLKIELEGHGPIVIPEPRSHLLPKQVARLRGLRETDLDCLSETEWISVRKLVSGAIDSLNLEDVAVESLVRVLQTYRLLMTNPFVVLYRASPCCAQHTPTHLLHIWWWWIFQEDLWTSLKNLHPSLENALEPLKKGMTKFDCCKGVVEGKCWGETQIPKKLRSTRGPKTGTGLQGREREGTLEGDGCQGVDGCLELRPSLTPLRIISVQSNVFATDNEGSDDVSMDAGSRKVKLLPSIWEWVGIEHKAVKNMENLRQTLLRRSDSPTVKGAVKEGFSLLRDCPEALQFAKLSIELSCLPRTFGMPRITNVSKARRSRLVLEFLAQLLMVNDHSDEVPTAVVSALSYKVGGRNGEEANGDPVMGSTVELKMCLAESMVFQSHGVESLFFVDFEPDPFIALWFGYVYVSEFTTIDICWWEKNSRNVRTVHQPRIRWLLSGEEHDLGLKYEFFLSVLSADTGTPKNHNEDEFSCRICFTRPIDTVLEPCSHALLCGSCANEVLLKMGCCTHCRAHITEVIQIRT